MPKYTTIIDILESQIEKRRRACEIEGEWQGFFYSR